MESAVTADFLRNIGMTAEAAALASRITALLADPDPVAAWNGLCREVLTPDQPFALHRRLLDILRGRWDDSRGPFPVWSPSPGVIENANITALMRHLGQDGYRVLQRWSVSEREAFWRTMIERLGIVFKAPWQRVLDMDRGPTAARWLAGAKINIADSCFAAEGARTALVYQESDKSGLATLTYDGLNRWSNRVANGLVSLGYQPGDAIAVDMPMTAASVAIYLGIIKMGGVVISIADSFSPKEIATRLRIGRAKGIFTTDMLRRAGKHLPMYAKVVEAGAPRAVVLPAGEDLALSLRAGDLDWDRFLGDSEAFESVSCAPEDTINILFSSGTTGDPKAIPWNHTTPIKCAADGWLHQDIHAGDLVAWPTNLGWMMGPWLIFATLINRGAIALYGDAPTSRGFCEFVRDTRVSMLGLVPSLVKAWRRQGTIDGLDWTAIKVFSSTGECANSEDMLFLMAKAGYRPVIEYCGGTEIGGGFLTGAVVRPAAPATFSTPALGLDFEILDEEGKPCREGELYLKPPSIGLSLTLLNKDHHKTYYAGAPAGPHGEPLRRHGDQIEAIGAGYFRALGRADDTMNLGGIKVSSAEIERALKSVPAIDESAAIAVSPADGGPSQLVIYAVLLAGAGGDPDSLKAELQKAVRTKLNPLFKIHQVRILATLPRTASGKVMRRVLRRLYLESC